MLSFRAIRVVWPWSNSIGCYPCIECRKILKETSLSKSCEQILCLTKTLSSLAGVLLNRSITAGVWLIANCMQSGTVYPKKYAHGFCFAVLCCGYTLTDFPISIRLTSLALWQSNDCPSASKSTLMNMDKYFIWIHYERLHNHNKAKHNKTVCISLGIYCNVEP